MQLMAKKLSHLDGLRGLAALLVTFVHIAGFTPYPALSQTLASQNKYYLHRLSLLPVSGPIPVSVFFILSGRVIALSFLRAKAAFSSENNTITPKYKKLLSALIRRPFRLLIPAISASLIMWLFTVWNLFNSHKGAKIYLPKWWNTPNSKDMILDIFVHIKRSIGTVLFAQKNPPYFIPVQWTLYHEFVDSYWIFTLAAVGSIIQPSRRILLYTCVYLTAHLFNLANLPDFIFGLILAELSEFGVFDKVQTSKKLQLIPAISLLASPLTFIFFDKVITKRETLCHFTAVFLLIAVELSPAIQYLLSRPFCLFLGHISFGMYLLHPILIHSICTMLVPYTIWVPYTKGTVVGLSVYLRTLVMIFSVFFYTGWVFHKTVDLWSVTVGHSIEKFFYDGKPDLQQIRDLWFTITARSWRENIGVVWTWLCDIVEFWWDLLFWSWVKWGCAVFVDSVRLVVRVIRFLWKKVGMKVVENGQYLPVSDAESLKL